MLICIEGSDGSGKSSVAEALAKKLRGKVISFPNDAGYTGPMIRAYLRREWFVTNGNVVPVQTQNDYKSHQVRIDKSSALAFQALQIANRMEVMDQLIDAVDEGHPCHGNIVLARYWQSGWVYGRLDGLDPEWLLAVHKTMAQPHMNILLDITPEESMRRRASRDGELPPERYEGKLDLTTKVIELYRKLWRGRGGTEPFEWPVVDANASFDAVVAACWRALIQLDPRVERIEEV